MKISVIIPTYKPRDYLWECLNSLMNQNLSKDDFEIVLVLNGCCEPWKSMVKSYIDKEMKGVNVDFIQVDSGGVSNARNIGLDCAKGEYITFIDDDDFISPSYLEELLRKASPTVISLCYPLSFIDGTQEYVPYLITKDFEKNSGLNSCNYKRAKKFFSGPVYKLIHRDIIGDRRFDLHFHNGEDSIFMFLISDQHVLLLENLIHSKKANASVSLPNEKVATKNYQTVVFSKQIDQISSYEIELTKFVSLPNHRHLTLTDDDTGTGNDVCRLDSKECTLPLTVRTRRLGDRMYLKGTNGRKKLKDIFIDKKIPLDERDLWPVVVDAKGEIVWLPGLQKSKFDKKKTESYDIIIKYH